VSGNSSYDFPRLSSYGDKEMLRNFLITAPVNNATEAIKRMFRAGAQLSVGFKSADGSRDGERRGSMIMMATSRPTVACSARCTTPQAAAADSLMELAAIDHFDCFHDYAP
jgi:hypothetical protein